MLRGPATRQRGDALNPDRAISKHGPSRLLRPIEEEINLLGYRGQTSRFPEFLKTSCGNALRLGAHSRNSRTFGSQVSALTSHSQTSNTRYPSLSSSTRFLLSRARLSLSFFRQNSTLVVGLLLPWVQLWPCQKHPWMNRAFLLAGKTRSGLPGNPLGAIR